MIHTDLAQFPTWNVNVVEIRAICHIDTNTDVTYSISAPQMRGSVSSRDFLDVRQYWIDADTGTLAVINESVYSNLMPPKKIVDKRSIVRGFNGPNLWRFTPITADQCQFEWFQNTNLRGHLPRRLVNNGTQAFIVEFGRSLVRACQQEQMRQDSMK